jgi:hypothetical protein
MSDTMHREFYHADFTTLTKNSHMTNVTLSYEGCQLATGRMTHVRH